MNPYRVLIVDDEPETSLILSSYLTGEYESFVAGNGLDALLQIDQIEPDVVIVDVVMPVMSGLEFVRRLRSLPRFERTLVVFLSARDQDQSIRDGYETGADVYLTKPFDPETVRILLRNLIEDTGLEPGRKAYTLAELSEYRMSRKSFPQAEEGEGRSATSPAVSRILIVDDDPVILQLLAPALRPEFEVMTASDGLEALDLAYLYKPDMFLIDWVLPRVSGVQMVRVLQSTLEFLNAPMFIISARSGEKDRNYVDKLQVAEFFAKPLDPERILAALRGVARRPEYRVRRHRPALPGLPAPDMFAGAPGRSSS